MKTRVLPFLPLRDGVLLPGATATVPVGRTASVALVTSVEAGAEVVVGVQKDAAVVEPTLADVQPLGVVARVQRVQRLPRGFQVTLEGKARVKVLELVKQTPFLTAQVEEVRDIVSDEHELDDLVLAVKAELKDLEDKAQGPLARTIEALGDEDDPSALADRTAATLGLPVQKEVAVLLAVDVVERLRVVMRLVAELKAQGEVRERIDNEVRKEFHKSQREAILREQLKAIQKELAQGGGGGPENDLERLKERLEKADLPDEVRKVAEREMNRLQGQASGPEQGVIRNYLEWILDLPWKVKVEEKGSIDDVQHKLDLDHTGLDEPKKRILEHLAVLQMTGTAKATILCLVGPPGVGKTSLGQSVADALGRPFQRISFGGVRDEAEVRGHRRTYVGAIPGRIISALKKAGAKNPVFLLDEVDKLGKGWAGDPEAALLEVLDPEQNHTFTDHFMELPFDLSEVLFLCTANDVSTLAPALRDRLEVIEIQGYTADEKLGIAKKHLIPKKLGEHGLDATQLEVTDAALKDVIAGYTREAGVRQLQREITRLCRNVALQVARTVDKKLAHQVVTPEQLKDMLGKPKFFDERAERTMLPGVAIGLAWTPVGGDILFIETSRMPGKGSIQITGQLGDVMKESANAALTYVRSNAEALGVDPRFLAESDLHIHIPAGAIPKDGPSAGVTMFTALVSLLTGRKVRSDTAMTGEATLRGRVLPVGGIKSKLLAAHRAGIKRVMLPEKNARDLDEVPDEVKGELEIVLCSDMRQVLEAALEHDVMPPSDTHGGTPRGARA
ncbi:MAG: endopeptidase La [Deltaproteobacteria bacterium RBG_16_71_12]|nr:MAG: endopeptidase La [Deltaproteobacteria bacterium RBG_16_71_12]